MNRRYSWPDKHWSWPVPLTHKHGVRSGEWIFTGGQAALDEHGVVQFSGDLASQLTLVMAYVESILLDLDAGTADLVKLICYFTGDGADEKMLLEMIASMLDAECLPVVNTVQLPELCYPGMRIEIDAVAMQRATSDESGGDEPYRKQINLPTLYRVAGGFPAAVRVGDSLFTGDLCSRADNGTVLEPDNVIGQTRIMMNNLDMLLQASGCEREDVLKVNVYYTGDGTAENWERPARIRADYFNDPGPAATGLVVNSFAQPGLMTKLFVTAMRSRDGSSMAKKYVWPDGHWDWTAKLPYKHGNLCGRVIHVGGQVSLDSESNVIDPNDMVSQTRRAMKNIETVLAGVDATLDDVVKVTAFYQGNASAQELHQNLEIRSSSYSDPGPATTGIPVTKLVYEKMVIEIEVIAIIGDRREQS